MLPTASEKHDEAREERERARTLGLSRAVREGCEERERHAIEGDERAQR
jgi:hypothetical protein